MANRTFNIPKSKSTPKRVNIAGTIDVAARQIAIAAQVTGSSIQAATTVTTPGAASR